MYFAVIAVMQCFDSISISGGKPVMLMPLISVVVVSMVKDAFEDYKRHKNDDQENYNKTLKLNNHSNQFQEVPWKSLQVGDILKVLSDEFIPADFLLLHSSGTKGTCFVETKNLDGETNLKIK